MSDEQQQPEIPLLRPGAEGYYLDPIETPHTNATLKAPPGMEESVRPLRLELCLDPDDRTLVSVSAWDLDDKQRDLIAAGAHLRLGVWQHPIPPLSLQIEPPFCDTCKAPKVYVRSEREFACAGACPDRDPRFGEPGVPASGNGQPIADSEKSPLDQAHEDFTPGEEERPEG